MDLLRQAEASMKRLGVDHLDLYLVHGPDPTTPLEETVRAMDDLVSQGKVHYIGASNMPAWLLAKALWTSDKCGMHRFEWVQNSYSLLDTADDNEVLPLCRDQGLGHTPFSPLAGGFLTGKYRHEQEYPSGSPMTLRPEPYLPWWNDETFARLERFRAAADDHGVSMAGLASAWLRWHPDITAPIVGPRGPAHFAPLREALDLQLDNEAHQAIGQIFTEPGAP